MDKNSKSDTPQRRIVDQLPAETIDWSKPEAPAGPAKPAARAPRATGTITNEQIAAGAAILCDHRKPIGRNAAIDVFEAMTALATPAATSGDAPDLQQLKALALAATPGIWEAQRHGVIVAGPMRQYTNGSARSQIAAFGSTFHEDDADDEPDRKQANAEFCAAARPEVVLDLIARIENLSAALKMANERLAELTVRPATASGDELPAPFFYYRARKDGAVEWGEDCCCQDDVYTNEATAEEYETHGGKVYSEAQVRALLTRAAVSAATKPTACALPPTGWTCTRAPGHEGPCAAVPTEICADDYTPEQMVIYQHGVEDGKLIARGMERYKAGIAARDAATKPAAVPAVPTDEQIVAALHSCGIDTRPSKYGFDALQIDGTSVPGLREVFMKLYAAAPSDTPAAQDQAMRALDALDGMGFTYDEEIGWLPPAASSDAASTAEQVREKVRDAVANALAGTYYCNRVWSAWGVGTMSQDDFSPADEDDDILDNVVDSVFDALKSAATQTTEGAGNGD